MMGYWLLTCCARHRVCTLTFPNTGAPVAAKHTICLAKATVSVPNDGESLMENN